MSPLMMLGLWGDSLGEIGPTFTYALGIACGLFAALSQSFSYFTTRHYVQRRPAGHGSISASRQLLVLSHVWMGLFACAALPLVWPAAEIPWGQLALPLGLSVVCYISGQLGLVSALKHAEASRVSPLMTSKLIGSSLLVMAYGQPVGATGRWLTPLQWAGVVLCTVAGISISFTGGRMKRRAALGIAWSAASFSMSDWFINRSIAGLIGPGLERFRASLLVLVMIHLVLGVVALPLLSVLGSRKGRDWVDAVPFALTWTGAMIGLFTAFAAVGILLGSILQCTRAFIAIVLGAAIMRLGHHHIEPPAPRAVMVRRLLAGFLMFVGITVYVIFNAENYAKIFGRTW